MLMQTLAEDARCSHPAIVSLPKRMYNCGELLSAFWHAIRRTVISSLAHNTENRHQLSEALTHILILTHI